MKEYSDEYISSHLNEFPDWVTNILGKSGMYCKLGPLDTFGVFECLSEDKDDYYYKVKCLDKESNEYKSRYWSCLSNIQFDNLDKYPDYKNFIESYNKSLLRVEVEKLTNIDNAKEFITASLNDHKESKIKDLKKLYLSEHSPMYTQIFIVKLYNIPSYVSTHFRTHKKNFIAETVTTNRIDRGGSSAAGRLTPVDMIIYCNAKTLVDMSLKRLCTHADATARKIMNMIKDKVKEVDEDLYRFMVPQCLYRCGLCQEWKSCGYVKTEKFKSDLKDYISGFENNCMNNLLNL